jgi:uroporphyrinogen-III synthase
MTQPAFPVLIIRAEPGAQETARRVAELGFAAIVSPVLIMRERTEAVLPDEEHLSGLVFTSANGVRAYLAHRPERTLPAWCVGPATAAAARAAGFARVYESAGNATDLANFIARHVAPAIKPLLHVANAAASGEVKRLLAEQGIETVFAPLYDMLPSASLSDAANSILDGDLPCIVLVHSAKGAQRFAELCAGQCLNHLTVAAISDSAARPLNTLDLNAVYIAPEPNEDGLIAALNTAIVTLSARSDTI